VIDRRRRAEGFIALAVVLMLAACGPQPRSTADADTTVPPTTSEISIPALPRTTLPDGTRVSLELAITSEEIGRGLMFRPSLPDDRGMLFLFNADRVASFWMKNTIIPLDLVFLDREGRVVDLIENARPCPADPCPQYVPDRPTRAVLELAAGSAARHGVAVGQELPIENVEGYPVQSPAETSEE
jgi:uncharacterized membrane protein (UPF0127 family)